jgi:hypothetical protein
MRAQTAACAVVILALAWASNSGDAREGIPLAQEQPPPSMSAAALKAFSERPAARTVPNRATRRLEAENRRFKQRG